jgi:hypothetical protein
MSLIADKDEDDVTTDGGACGSASLTTYPSRERRECYGAILPIFPSSTIPDLRVTSAKSWYPLANPRRIHALHCDATALSL